MNEADRTIRVVVADDQTAVRDGLVMLLGLMPGIAVLGSACAHGPASSRCGTPCRPSSATVRKELLR